MGAPGTRGDTGDFGPEVRLEIIMCMMYFLFIMRRDLPDDTKTA